MRLEMADPKGLIRESYRIDGISAEECRSIFLDWALSLPEGASTKLAIRRLIAEYGGRAGHPMNDVLEQGLATAPTPGRKGGRRARVGD